MDTHQTIVSSMEEENSEMVGKTDLGSFGIDLDSLPDDKVLMQILTRVPARYVFEATMAVCTKWYLMIHTRDFISAHLRHSTSGLLVGNVDSGETTFMSMTTGGQIEMSQMPNYSINCIRPFWSSCNGLTLEPDFRDRYELVITNPVTNAHIALPPFVVRNEHPNSRSAIAYVDTDMKYKVVRTYCLGVPNPQSRVYCAVLTVGVDSSWRVVDTQHLSLATSEHLSLSPIVTGGFVHWAQDWDGNAFLRFNKENGIITTQMSNNYVLTMNIETEIITQIPAPQCNGGYYYYKYFSGEGYLSLLIGRGYLKWEVWEMKPETGEWIKLPDIDLEAHKGLLNESYDREESALKPGDGDCLDCKLIPVGWLKYPEVIVFVAYRPTRGGYFCQARLHAAYNVETRDISLFELDYSFHPYLVHRNSLIGIIGMPG